jgi:hypothetical protein
MSDEEAKNRIIGYRQAARDAMVADSKSVDLLLWQRSYPNRACAPLHGRGPLGDVIFVDPRGKQFLATVRYDAAAVVEWCDRWLSEEGGKNEW